MGTYNPDQQMEEPRQSIGEWLSRPFMWRIPVYQRHYAWDATAESGPVHLFWDTVKEQTIARLEGKAPPAHYFGAVIVDNKTDRNSTDPFKLYDVVDGQQRLTTIQLALFALIEVAKKYDCYQDIQSKLEPYVFCDIKKNLTRLSPTNFDRKQYQTVLWNMYGELFLIGQNVSDENARKSKIYVTFDFFNQEFKRLEEEQPADADKVLHAVMDTLLNGFDMVLIVLRESDDAQRVFESLNDYAKPLTTFDLIRNNVFYRAALCKHGKDVELFNTNTWQQLEEPYWEEKADNRKSGWATHIEVYIARMLVASIKKSFLFNRNEIFRNYKEFAKTFSTIDDEIDGLVRYVDVYRHLDGHEKKLIHGVNLGIFYRVIYKSRDFYPMLFSIVESDLDLEEKQRMVNILESYVVRRSICGLTTKNYNMLIVALFEKLGKDQSYANLSNALKAEAGDSTFFPDDTRVMKDCVTTRFYRTAFPKYVFEQIENSMHDDGIERVTVKEGQLTIDHILPQKWENNAEWKKLVLRDDDANSEYTASIVKNYLDTIGNLTLMSGKNNTIKSNQSLDAVKGLLAESTVRLNRDLANQPTWNMDEIIKRSKWLGEKVCSIWPYDIV